MYQNYTILTDFSRSFEKQTDMDFHLFVVDLSRKKKSFERPDFTTYIPALNRGYAYGINIGVERALSQGYDMLCITNSDIVARKDFVQNIKKSINSHPFSLVGGKIYYEAGAEYHKDRYQPQDLGNVIWYAGGINDWKNSTTIHRGVDEVDRGQYEKLEKTDFITGCLMGYDKKTAQTVGKWNEGYFLYYEDADYCERAKKAGIQLYYDPSLVIWHKNAASTGGSGSSMHQKYQKINQLKFGLKFAPLRTKIHLLRNFILS